MNDPATNLEEINRKLGDLPERLAMTMRWAGGAGMMGGGGGDGGSEDGGGQGGNKYSPWTGIKKLSQLGALHLHPAFGLPARAMAIHEQLTDAFSHFDTPKVKSPRAQAAPPAPPMDMSKLFGQSPEALATPPPPMIDPQLAEALNTPRQPRQSTPGADDSQDMHRVFGELPGGSGRSSTGGGETGGGMVDMNAFFEHRKGIRKERGLPYEWDHEEQAKMGWSRAKSPPLSGEATLPGGGAHVDTPEPLPGGGVGMGGGGMAAVVKHLEDQTKAINEMTEAVKEKIGGEGAGDDDLGDPTRGEINKEGGPGKPAIEKVGETMVTSHESKGHGVPSAMGRPEQEQSHAADQIMDKLLTVVLA